MDNEPTLDSVVYSKVRKAKICFVFQCLNASVKSARSAVSLRVTECAAISPAWMSKLLMSASMRGASGPPLKLRLCVCERYDEEDYNN